MKKYKNVIWGVAFVVVGLLLALNALEIINFTIFFKGWWTLFIIIPSVVGLLTDHDKVGNLIGLLIGVILLLMTRGIVDGALISKLIIPAIIILIGISFISKELKTAKVKDGMNVNPESDETTRVVTFSGEKYKMTDEVKLLNLEAIFGGIVMDLTKAKIKDAAIINTTSVFGGIDILVPEDVEVIVNSSSVFGGVTNHVDREEKKKIYLNSTCIFGGVEVK